MKVDIRLWHDAKIDWFSVYNGEYEDMPDEHRELVAMLDASDRGELSGVGTSMDEYFFDGDTRTIACRTYWLDEDYKVLEDRFDEVTAAYAGSGGTKI